MMREHLAAFQRARNLVESYDPTHASFESPGIVQLANQFKRAALGHDPDNEEQMWDTHLDKEGARSQLMGRIHDSFPYLDHGAALDLAARHMKVGKTPKHAQLAALGALYKARDNSERGISFGTPFHAVRAAGFMRAVNHHYPNLAHSLEHFPEAGVSLVAFPGGEHMPPPPPEELPPEEVPPDAGMAPPEESPPEEAPPQAAEPEPDPGYGAAPIESVGGRAGTLQEALRAFRTSRAAQQRR